MENMVKPPDAFWAHRNVFVSGCSGFLGSWIVRVLLEKGAHVVGLVRDRVPASPLIAEGDIARIVVVSGDITDYPLLERTFGEYEIDTVFHLAAQAIVGVANSNPMATFDANVRGAWTLLEAARRNRSITRILVASSDKAYGEHDKLPYEETDALQGSHPYDVSKSCADLIAHTYHHTYNLPVCVTRCGNLFGGGDLNFNRVIPGTIRSVLMNERPIVRSDGKYIRDYLYALDAAYAYLLLAEKMDDRGIVGEAFNFSNEVQLTVLELVEKILALMGRPDLPPVVLNEVTSEIKHQYLSAAKARRLLNWNPRYSVDEGLRQTIAWYSTYFSKAAAGSPSYQ